MILVSGVLFNIIMVIIIVGLMVTGVLFSIVMVIIILVIVIVCQVMARVLVLNLVMLVVNWMVSELLLFSLNMSLSLLIFPEFVVASVLLILLPF